MDSHKSPSRVSLFLSICTLFAVSAFAQAPLDGAGGAGKELNIVVAGDSTVWGGGLLDAGSVAGPVDDYVKSSLSKTVMPDAMRFKDASGSLVKPEIYKNPKQYKGASFSVSGKGSSVEFDFEGEQLYLCQTIRRTSAWASMEVFSDGELVGSFDNKNATLGKAAERFSGDGKRAAFDLERPFTYGHKATLDGRELKGGLNTGSYMTQPPFSYFPDFDYLIVRKYDSKKAIVHAILFRTPPPPGRSVEVSYSYGETLCHTKCTVGELADDSKIESVFGSDKVSFDPANPSYLSSGLDFRSVNKAAFFHCALKGPGKHRVAISLKDGVNPYFALNFATDRLRNVVNAGIGGWRADLFLNDSGKRGWKDILDICVPDVLFLALAPNDDWAEGRRLSGRALNYVSEASLKTMPSLELASAKCQDDGLFSVEMKSGLIDAISERSLTSKSLLGNKEIQAGHFVRVGNYSGDNRSVAVREIESFDPVSGVIAWKAPLKAGEILCLDKLDSLAGREFSVRTLSKFKANMKELAGDLKKANPAMKIVLVNLLNANYFSRDLWGYPEALGQVASSFEGVSVLDMAPLLQRELDAAVSEQGAVTLETLPGVSEYELPWKGHWQGFKALLDGSDVYGKLCYVRSGEYWAVPQDKSGKALDFKTDSYYRPFNRKDSMKLVFERGVPPAGTKIVVQRASFVWSGDFCHPNDKGCAIIGEACAKRLAETLGR